MNFGMVILYILLFILCLSVLIVVHELGHLAMAKAFNVYCLEFSVGFGPALFRKKRKNGETYFALRAIPLGGYVSMYEEGVELPEGVEVDESRCFSHIKKWKRLIILFAGVFNNALLALLIFFISEQACVQKSFVYYQEDNNLTDICFEINTLEGSIAEEAGMKGVQWQQYQRIASHEENDYLTSNFLLDKSATVSYNSGISENIAAVVKTDSLTFVSSDYLTHLHFYKLSESTGDNIYDGIDFSKEILASDTTITGIDFASPTVQFTRDENDKIIKSNATIHLIHIGIEMKETDRVFNDCGIQFYVWERYNTFPTAIENTFSDFAYASTAIVRAIGGLFTSAENWKNIGGIVAIGVQTTNVLNTMGIGRFLYVWALISVNLAIINLFPFPGLDGWQILVLIVEWVAHKEIPEKVKNVVSVIGLVLLMAFAALIFVKDIIGLF